MIKFTEQQEKIIQSNFERNGAEKQREKLVEELSELLCEVCKHRTKGGRESQICEELADVLVVLKGFGIEVSLVSYTHATTSHIIDLLIAYIGNVNKNKDLTKHRLKHFGNYLCYLSGYDENEILHLQKAVDFKIARMEKKQNNQVEPFEFNN